MTTNEAFKSRLTVARKEMERRQEHLRSVTESHNRMRDVVRCMEELRQCCSMPNFGSNDSFERFLVRDYASAPNPRAHVPGQRLLTSVRGLIVKSIVESTWGMTRIEDRNEQYFYQRLLARFRENADIGFGTFAEAMHDRCGNCRRPAPLTVVSRSDDELGCFTAVEKICISCLTLETLASTYGHGKDAPFALK